MRKIKIVNLGKHLDEDTKSSLERTFKWNKRWAQSFNGFPYEEELAGSDGMSFAIYVPEGVDLEEVNKAIDVMKSERDVVGYGVFSLPMSFFEEQGWSFK